MNETNVLRYKQGWNENRTGVESGRICVSVSKVRSKDEKGDVSGTRKAWLVGVSCIVVGQVARGRKIRVKALC